MLMNCKFADKANQDLNVWIRNNTQIKTQSRMFAYGFCMIDTKEYRNVVLNRLHSNPIFYLITRILFRPLESLYINMPPENVGGGLYFQHGFSTIIAAKEIGEYCDINQQVTVGYKGDSAAVIGNNVKICAGAIIVGGVKIEDGAKIGAGAVVTHDVEANDVVVGVPAKTIKHQMACESEY